MTTDLKLSDVEQKIFLNFIEQLAKSNISSTEEYNKTIKKYIDIVREKPNPINLEGIILEAAEFLGNSIPSWKTSQWPGGFSQPQKKGFDKLYNYAPDKVKNMLKNGEGKKFILDLYSVKASALATLAKAGIEISTDGKIKKEDKKRALIVLASVVEGYGATTKPDEVLDKTKITDEEDKKAFAKPEEILEKMCDESNSIGYFNHPLRNPSRFYKHVAAMCKATDQALANIVIQYPYFVTMAYLDSEQSIKDAHELNSAVSVNDGQRDIFKKAEAFFEKKIAAFQSSKACEASKEKYTAKAEKLPALAGEIVPLIIDVDKQYSKYFNDYNNQKSTFNFLDYATRQLGHEVKWDEDGYFLVYAPKKMKKEVEQEMEKYLPNLIAASFEEENGFSDLAHEVNGKIYKAKIVKTKACMFKAGYSEAYVEVTDDSAPTEVHGCTIIAEMIKNDKLKGIKVDDEVQVALSVSPRSIRIKSIAKCKAVYLGDGSDGEKVFPENKEVETEMLAAKQSTIKYQDYLIINPEFSDKQNDEKLKKQVLKQIKNYNISLVSVKPLENSELTEDDGLEVVIILKGSEEELRKFYKEAGNNEENVISLADVDDAGRYEMIENGAHEFSDEQLDEFDKKPTSESAFPKDPQMEKEAAERQEKFANVIKKELVEAIDKAEFAYSPSIKSFGILFKNVTGKDADKAAEIIKIFEKKYGSRGYSFDISKSMSGGDVVYFTKNSVAEASIPKERVHNQMEAEVLIKEAFQRGEEDKYSETAFFTHTGEKLFDCIIDVNSYTMMFPNGNAKTMSLASVSSVSSHIGYLMAEIARSLTSSDTGATNEDEIAEYGENAWSSEYDANTEKIYHSQTIKQLKDGVGKAWSEELNKLVEEIAAELFEISTSEIESANIAYWADALDEIESQK